MHDGRERRDNQKGAVNPVIIMIERTTHFFNDAVDLLDPVTSIMLVVPMPVYTKMRRAGKDDARIYWELDAKHEARV